MTMGRSVMRAIRAIAGTAALVMALMGTSATGALAASGKAKGYITVPSEGTLSFHASKSGGGFEITEGNTTLVGKVVCYEQDPTTGTNPETTQAAFLGVLTKGPQKGDYVTVYLENVTPGNATDGDTFRVVDGGDPDICPEPIDLTTVDGSSGYIDIR